jgi:hypothetical protein
VTPTGGAISFLPDALVAQAVFDAGSCMPSDLLKAFGPLFWAQGLCKSCTFLFFGTCAHCGRGVIKGAAGLLLAAPPLSLPASYQRAVAGELLAGAAAFAGGRWCARTAASPGS